MKREPLVIRAAIVAAVTAIVHVGVVLGLLQLDADMASASVAPGQTVAEGQPVGVMGMTGTATGVHVHWEVRVGGIRQNPAAWLANAVASPAGGNQFFTREQYRAVQGGYAALGYDLGTFGADGVEGPTMRGIVKNFQAKHNLDPDGVHGPKTEAALIAAQPKPAPAPAPAPAASGAKTADFGRVDVVQAALKARYPLYAGGLDVDNIDGPDTRLAVAEFQRRAGLDADGVAGPITRRALGV